MSRRHIALDRRRWSRVREAVIRRDGWRCRSCGHPGGPFEVDHVRPLHRNPDQDPYDPDGCQTLCKPCHAEKTKRESRPEATPAERAWHDLVDAIHCAPQPTRES